MIVHEIEAMILLQIFCFKIKKAVDSRSQSAALTENLK